MQDVIWKADEGTSMTEVNLERKAWLKEETSTSYCRVRVPATTSTLSPD